MIFHRSPSPTRCQTGHIRVSLVSFRLEHDLTPELSRICVPPVPVSAFPSVHLPRLQLEPTRLVRLRSHEQILEVLVWRVIHFLLERTHKSHTWLDALRDLGVEELEQQAVLPGERISNFGDLVAWPADLDDVLPHRDGTHHARNSVHDAFTVGLFFGLFRSTAGEVGLVLATLGVGEVRAIVLMHSETEATLEAADVVLEEVWVLV